MSMIREEGGSSGNQSRSGTSDNNTEGGDDGSSRRRQKAKTFFARVISFLASLYAKLNQPNVSETALQSFAQPYVIATMIWMAVGSLVLGNPTIAFFTNLRAWILGVWWLDYILAAAFAELDNTIKGVKSEIGKGVEDSRGLQSC